MIFAVPLKLYLQLFHSQKSVFPFPFCPAVGDHQPSATVPPSDCATHHVVLRMVVLGFPWSDQCGFSWQEHWCGHPIQLPAFPSSDHLPLVLQVSQKVSTSFLSASSDGFHVTQTENARALACVQGPLTPPCLVASWASWPTLAPCLTLAMLVSLLFLKHSGPSCLRSWPLPFSLPETFIPAAFLHGFIPHLLQVPTEMSLFLEGFSSHCLK